MATRVMVNGFGTIGKRVAHAVTLQDDMTLAGVANRSVSIHVQNMLGENGMLQGTPFYSSGSANQKEIHAAGLNYQGSLEDLLRSGDADVVVDCTAEGVEEQNKPLYEKYGVKQIYQGGAAARVAEMSFSTLGNYERALGKASLRVVSCNTTSLVRTLSALQTAFGVAEVFAVLVRRATDPADCKKGPINSVIPVTTVPSHHGPDVQTVLPDIDIKTMACKVPTTLAHTHFVTALLARPASAEEVTGLFRRTSRIALFNAKKGYTSTGEVVEFFRDRGRPRSDIYEACVWEDAIATEGRRVYWSHAVHSEAIVIPENIDAIRAITGTEKSRERCIAKTNASLGIAH